MRTIAKFLDLIPFVPHERLGRKEVIHSLGRGNTAFFSFVFILFLNSCFLSRPRVSPEPKEKINLQILCAVGPEEGPGARTELWIEASPGAGYQVLYRASPGKKPWLPVWDAAYIAPLSSKKMGRFLERLDLVDFFSLPPVLELSDEGKGDAILFRVQIGSRLHQVVARGKVLPSLTRCLEALQALSGVNLVLPKWYPPLRKQGKGSVSLVSDVRRSYLLHRKWLKGKELKPGRLLDLFALALKAGKKEEARKILAEIKAIPSAAGLLPALEALL